MCDNPKYGRALRRILFETERCLSYSTAVNSFADAVPFSNWSFFCYAYLAMYDGLFFHAIKVFDTHRATASFWYLQRCNPIGVQKVLDMQRLSLEELKIFGEKLKIIRDKTHFHLDNAGILNPTEVWSKADITGNMFNSIMIRLWESLKLLHIDCFNREFIQPVYNGEDIKPIIEAVKEKGIMI